ncbi:MAG TPA: hypothetical protein VJ902_09950, partial [Wenzhouxiangellaceae bacterium]|nr:hypothetical protein [Wenzhouxiangellaceae bacterium]
MRDSLVTRAGMLLGLLLMTLGIVFSTGAAGQPVQMAEELEPAKLTVLVFEQGRPVEGLIMRFGDETGRTDDGGVWQARVPPQSGRLTIFDNAQALTALPMTLRSGEIVQVIITLTGPER